MKVLVTGANGYLGRGIVNHIINAGHTVIAVDYSLEGVDDRSVKMECDLFEVQEPFLSFDQPDVILHLAWRDGFQHYSDAHVEDFPKHYYFLKSFIESKIQRIAVMGSMHEIGFFEGSIKEDTPCNPITPYGICKNALRELIQMACSRGNVEFQWLRGFYIVGNAKNGSSIFSKISQAESRGDKFFPFTRGQNQFDFIDYDYFCECVARTVLQNKVTGIINICSGHPEKLSDRVERFIKENDFKIKLEYGAFPDRPYDSKAVWGNDREIREIMGIHT